MAIRTAISVDANELMEFIKRATRKWARRRFGDEPGDEFVDNHVSFETWHHEDGYMVFEVRGEWDYDGAYSLVYDYLNPTVECFLCSNKYHFKTPTINVLQLFIPDEKIGGKRSAVDMSATRRNAYLFEDDVDEMLSVMDRARDAWAGPGWYCASESMECAWCDYVGDLELLVSRAYAAASGNDVVTVRYLGVGTEPHEVDGSRVMPNDNAKGKGAFGAKKTAQSSVATFEDINYLLSEAADACAELEDYYFGEPVVDYLVKAYDHCIDAWDQIDRASTLVSE